MSVSQGNVRHLKNCRTLNVLYDKVNVLFETFEILRAVMQL